MVYQILQIDERLRVLLAELEIYLGIKLNQAEVNRIYEEKRTDAVSFKSYTFYHKKNYFFPDWEITGAVDEYEPETLFLKSNGGLGKKRKFEEFFASVAH
jgi:hypothetical protein